MLKASLIGFYNTRESDPWEIIKKISGWGYKALEHGGFLLKGDVNENVKKLADLDFKVLGISSDIDGLKNNFNKIVDDAGSIGVKNIICYWSDAQSYGEALDIAGKLEEAGGNLSKAGLNLCYHNHEHEFKKSFNGTSFFDLLMAHTSNLYLDLDCGWATMGVGVENMPALLERLKDRIKLVHFKDFYDLNYRESFTALGTGKVDIQGLLKEVDKHGFAEYITVEQDVVRNLNTDDTVLLSYLTLKESGLVE